MLSGKVGIVALLASGLAAQAEVITFGTGGQAAAPPSFTEGSFTFTHVAGTEACFSHIGNPARSFSLGCGFDVAVGDAYVVTRTGGGTFTFTQFEISSPATAGSDTMRFRGQLGGFFTEDLPSVATSSPSWVTITTGFSGPIDLLRMEISALGNGYLLVDNLVLTAFDSAVPEPSMALPVGLALLAGGYLRRRR
jgi:hypothetical protein